MPRIDKDTLLNIPISSVARELGLDLSRGEHIACFMGHDNNTLSLSFNLKNNYYKCFGCDIKGKPIRLVMDYFNCNYNSAYAWLEERFFYFPSYLSKTLILRKDIQFNKSKFQRYKFINQKDIEVYEWLVANAKLSNEGFNYFKNERGYTLDTIEYFKLKDLPKASSFLHEAKDQWGLERLMKCGLWYEKDSKYMPIWYKHMLLLPFHNLENKIEFIQGRFLHSTPKRRYRNPIEVESTFFNKNILTKLQYHDRLYICEGVTDAISVYQDKKASIGIMGANNFKQKYMQYLLSYDLYVIPDNDTGGKRFFCNISNLFKSVNKKIKFVSFNKEFKDISDYLMSKK